MIELLLSLLLALTGVSRTEDADLTAIAQARVVEVQTDWSHAGQRSGTWEVLVMNSAADPVTRAVEQWRGSPSHWAILTDPSLTRIGCAVDQAESGAWYFACILQQTQAPATAPSVTSPPALVLPNTATAGCIYYEPIPPEEPTGVKGCVIYGEGIASEWPGPGVARNDCIYPWDDCVPIVVTSLETGRSITVTPTMYCDCYTGTLDERIVDLGPAAVAALGLDGSGLYPVRVVPLLLPNTSVRYPLDNSRSVCYSLRHE